VQALTGAFGGIIESVETRCAIESTALRSSLLRKRPIVSVAPASILLPIAVASRKRAGPQACPFLFLLKKLLTSPV